MNIPKLNYIQITLYYIIILHYIKGILEEHWFIPLGFWNDTMKGKNETLSEIGQDIEMLRK